MNNEFKWTTELVEELIWESFGAPDTRYKINQFVEEKSKEQLKPKDWEIVAFKAASAGYLSIYRMYTKKEDGRFWVGNDPNHFDEEFCLKMVNEKRHFSEDIWSIHSVRRLSDSEVFSVWEVIQQGQINSFSLSNENDLHIHVHNDKIYYDYPYRISEISKAKQPLFTKDQIISLLSETLELAKERLSKT